MYSFERIKKIVFSTVIALIPIHQSSLIASELLIATSENEAIEEIKVKKVKKNGNLIVKFCSDLSDFSGYVTVENKQFLVSKADVIKGNKIVWKDTDLSKTKGDSIDTNSLYSEGKVILDGNCKVGILPIILLGGALAIGAGSSGSGSTSSN